MFRTHLSSNVHFVIVCGGESHAEAVKTQLEHDGISGEYDCLDHGFTSFVVNRAGAEFFQER